MTVAVTPEGRIRAPWYRHPAARVAAGLARLLIALPPRRLRQVLLVLRRGSRPATAAEALRARDRVVGVSARCAGLGCLQRSVATVLLCRMRGAWPDWCTGIRTQPFRAHAWVEAEGAAVGEPGDMTLFHTVMAVRR